MIAALRTPTRHGPPPPSHPRLTGRKEIKPEEILQVIGDGHGICEDHWRRTVFRMPTLMALLTALLTGLGAVSRCGRDPPATTQMQCGSDSQNQSCRFQLGHPLKSNRPRAQAITERSGGFTGLSGDGAGGPCLPVPPAAAGRHGAPHASGRAPHRGHLCEGLGVGNGVREAPPNYAVTQISTQYMKLAVVINLKQLS